MGSINDLPVEMIFKLFKHLDPRDLVACSLMNKRLRSFYLGFRLQRLAVNTYPKHLGFTLFKWSYPDRRIEDRELCQLDLFCNLVDQPLLSNLQHLSLSGYWLDVKNLSGLFTDQLVHLELSVHLISGTELHLKLPRLRVLAFHKENNCISLSVDCPKLNVLLYLETTSENLLEVKHPETIRTLETNMFGSKLDRFKGVECLIIKDSRAISVRSLLSLPQLNELHYNESISKIVWDTWNFSHVRTKQRLREFLEVVQASKGPEFKFTFAGFQVSEEMLDQIDFGARDRKKYTEASDEYLYLKNYQLIKPEDKLGFIRTIDYSRLMKVARGELSIFEKFTGIQAVLVEGRIKDTNHFLRFLRSLSLLSDLTLRYFQGQEFYDQLPASTRSLDMLNLYGEEEWQLNFGFITRFSRISRLLIANDLSHESLASLVGCLANLRRGYLRFPFKGQSMSIKKPAGSMMYEVINRNSQNVLKTENPNEILNFFQRRL